MVETPTIPISVWEQIPVIIVFSLLLTGIGWLAFKAFTNAVAGITKSFADSVSNINKYYATIIENNNKQWQAYFDARSESSKLVNDSIIKQLAELASVIEKMDANFTAHDAMERQALADMAEKRRQPRAK